MRVLISGATGMIGSALVDALTARGDEVGALVRPSSHAAQTTTGRDIAWDPDAGTIDAAALAAGGFDAVMHLGGVPLLGRWNDQYMERIRDSRVDGTRLLATTLAELPVEHRPDSLLVASASGFYGSRGEELLTEDAAPGSDFLAGVVSDWEAAADPAHAAGIRTLHLRMAPVQSTEGGALKTMLLPFKLGAGGRIGNGRQWAPWIGLTEAIAIWLFLLDHPDAAGPVNVVGPTPCRSAEYTRTLGKILHRPTLIPAPIPLMKLALGSQLIEEMLLTSQKVLPARLEALGYDFMDRTIADALRRELDR